MLQRKEEEIDPLLELHRAPLEVVVAEDESVQDAINIILLQPAQQPPQLIQEQKDGKGRLYEDYIKRQCLQDIQSQKFSITSEKDDQLHLFFALEDLKVDRINEGSAPLDEESDLHQ